MIYVIVIGAFKNRYSECHERFPVSMDCVKE